MSKRLPWGTPTNPIPWGAPTRMPTFVFDERSLEKLSDIKEQGFMSVPDILELAKANNDVYRQAYLAGQVASAKVISRLEAAIENYLSGETGGNVTCLNEALAYSASAKEITK